MKIRRFGKNYMQKILIDRFCEFQKLTQKWKFLTFLAIFTYYKAFNGIIFIFLVYSRPLWAHWCIFQKNPSQIFFLIKSIVPPLPIPDGPSVKSEWSLNLETKYMIHYDQGSAKLVITHYQKNKFVKVGKCAFRLTRN